MNDVQGKVLVVKDDWAFRSALCMTLAGLGFDIGEASTGEEALTCLNMDGYDAVLLDINMPGMGGIEACRRIRHTTSRLPILMLTVRDSQDDRVEALDVGPGSRPW